jgi:hypothetical protein
MIKQISIFSSNFCACRDDLQFGILAEFLVRFVIHNSEKSIFNTGKPKTTGLSLGAHFVKGSLSQSTKTRAHEELKMSHPEITRLAREGGLIAGR